jgi:hypothetical protein
VTVIGGGWMIDSSSPPPRHPPTRSSSSLSVVVGRLATDKEGCDNGGGVQGHTTDARLAAINCCPPSALRLRGQHNVAPPPANEVYCCCRLHVIVARARSKERWISAVWRHHRRSGPPASPLDGALEVPSQSAVKSANPKSN